MEGHRRLVGSAEVKVADQLGVDGNLSGQQRMGAGEASLSQQISLGLDIHLMFIAELLIKIGGKVEQKSVGGT